ncbi:MAG: glutamine--fructose-6-phosphate aminotransferase, partial [Candidatus Bathyarchaeia archaeon]
IGNIVEMRSRGASVIAIGEEGDEEVMKNSDDYITIPRGNHELLTPIPYVVPLQLLAYHMALERNCDPDRPLNLAKSVTVP